MTRSELLGYSASIGAWLLYVLCLLAVFVVGVAVIVIVVRGVVMVLRVLTGRPRMTERMAVPFAGPGNQAADAPTPRDDLPPGMRLSGGDSRLDERARDVAGVGPRGTMGSPPPGMLRTPTGAVNTPPEAGQ